jgi:3'(2'), 5'-bisphosphate nucleotidase
VNLVATPGKTGGRRGYGDAALPFLRHPIHLRLSVVHLADPVYAPRLEQEAFADGGFAGVDVRDDADVAHARDFRGGCHPEGAGVYVRALSDYARELEIAASAAREAGAVILNHYARGSIAVETKADASPVTAADRDANAVIVARLAAAFPDDGILSEELPDDPRRIARRRVWIVDPLDGTRDFVARTGEFCVHVGLTVDGVPVVGAVFHPVAAALYTAAAGAGAFVEIDGRHDRLAVSAIGTPGDIRVGISRSHASAQLKTCLAQTTLGAHAVTMGASVKLMALARGELDAVINLGSGEQEWDTCAPETVIREAGGLVTDAHGHAFSYNQRNVTHGRGSIASNGACHTVVLGIVQPYARFDEASAR